MTKHIAMFINHESGGTVVAFHGFMNIFKENDYKIDLYRFDKAGEKFCNLSSLADKEINYYKKKIPPLKIRLPLLREYYNLCSYYFKLKNLDRLSKKMAVQIDSKNYDFVFVHVDQHIKNPHLLKYLNTKNYFFLAEPERRFYDPPSLFQDELDNTGEICSLRKIFLNIWYKPARIARFYLRKKNSDLNIRKSKTTIIANSYFSAESIFRAYDKIAHVCYLGIEKTTQVPLPFKNRENIVLTVGSLHPNKGHTFLVKALTKVPQNVRPKLVVVTDVKEVDRKRNLISLAYNLNVDISIKEKMNFSDLQKLYQKSKLFIFGSRLEPFGLAPLEAMSFGTPVIAIKSGGVRETVKDYETGLLSDWRTEEFADKIYLLLTNNELWNQLSQAGPKYVETEWNWEKTFSRFEKIVTSYPKA